MRNATSSVGVALLIGLVIGSAGPAAPGAMIALNEATQGGGNKGVSYRPTDELGQEADFVMTARTLIDATQPFLFDAPGSVGTVFIDGRKRGKRGRGRQSHKGAGVRRANAGGSKGISGGGRDADEELIFTFDGPVPLNALSVDLFDISFGAGAGDKDDPVIFLSTVSAGVVAILEPQILSAFTTAGRKTGTVAFAGFPLASGTSITAFAIRETNAHVYVAGISLDTAVPEAGTIFFLAAGAGCVVLRRRRAQNSCRTA